MWFESVGCRPTARHVHEEPPFRSQSIHSSEKPGNCRGSEGMQEDGCATNMNSDKERTCDSAGNGYSRRNPPSIQGMGKPELYGPTAC